MLVKKKFIERIIFLKKAIPKIDIDVDIAYQLLKELTEEQFSYAVLDICRDKNFKLYDNVIAEIWDRGINMNQLSAEEAWCLVLNQIREVGYNNQPFFIDYKIMKAINANGGWRKLCASNEIDWEKKRFIESYKNFRDSEQAQIRQGILPENKLTIDSNIKKLTSTIGNI